jgi:hypothetical protein
MGFRLVKSKNRIICFLLLASLLYPAIAYSVPADVIDISDNKYFDAVHSSLVNAKKSIYVSLFIIAASKRDKASLPCVLVQDLIDARKRGVNVIVRLDGSYDNQDAAGAAAVSRKNDEAYLELADAGIDCKYAIPTKTLHDKLIVIDEEIVIEGSMNWFSRALNLNRESASLIKSEEYAKEKIERIKNIETVSEEKPDRFQVETVAIRNKFLRDPALGASLVHNKSEGAFDIYLFFLKRFNETGQAVFALDYERLAKYLGMDPGRLGENRWEINRVLKNLRDKYKLIDCKIIFDKPAQVTLLDYDDRTKEYETPQKGYFNVPLAYWEYGWNRKLNLKTKYCYLISVYRTEFSEIKPWWSLPLSLLAEDFHLGKWTIMRGLRNLKKQGLLDVEYDNALNEEGKFSGREPNKYRLKPLLSQEQIDKGWADLKKAYNEKSVTKARELAFMIEQGNDIEIVGSFIRLMDEYGGKWVTEAAQMTARMRADNPSRNFGYIVGILRNWVKEGRVDY